MRKRACILETAKASLAEIVAIREAEADDEGSLAKAVMTIKTGTAVNADDSEVAQAKAKAVSDAIMAAMVMEDAPALPESAGPSDAPEGAVMHAGMSGMTFAEINGGSPGTAVMKIGDFSSDLAGEIALAALTGVALGGTTAAYCKGIQGSLVCLSAACGVEDGNITGTVEFVPASPSELYVQASVGSDYSRASNAASHGYWLNDMDQIQLHRATRSIGSDATAGQATTTSNLLWTHEDATADAPRSASCSGGAMGYSHRTVGEGDDATTSSGEFTANVMWEAMFGISDTTVSGSISGFAGGAQFNPARQVTLGSGSRTENAFSGPVTDGSAHGRQFATSGAWDAHGYGADGQNPTGFVGAFEAASGTEGEASGVCRAD
ncbi:MAG: hypothetical protein OXH79_19995 [Boseongicola sp.]|nr:hypothetical protein [Boseongicola sp.]